VDSDVAADEGPACGITVSQTDRNRVRDSGLSVISHIHAEPDFGPVVQTTHAAEAGCIVRNGETLNFAFRHAHTGSGIAKEKIVDAGAVSGLARAKLESDSITLAIDVAAAVDLRGHHDSRIIEFRARESSLVAKCSPRDEHHGVEQASCGMVLSRGVEATG